MRAVFSGRAQIQSWLDCWVALAKAEAKNGVIPESAAEEIAQKHTPKTSIWIMCVKVLKRPRIP